MVQIKKCQSLKHLSGGCGDLKCPEGLSIQKAMDKAVQDKDISSYLKAKGLSEENFSGMRETDGFLQLRFKQTTEPYPTYVCVPLDRPKLVEDYKAIDKTVLPSFDNMKEFITYVDELYPKGVRYSAWEDGGSASPWKSIHVDIKVDADLRGVGVGRHIRQMLMKYADEHNIVIGGTPTNAGDGTVLQTIDLQEQYKQVAMNHRARLVKFYLDSGYEYNFAYAPTDRVDYWTKEEHPQNNEWVDRFKPEARRFLNNVGFYVRWPNNRIPKNMLAHKKHAVNPEAV